jgi:hypothetical protein
MITFHLFRWIPEVRGRHIVQSQQMFLLDPLKEAIGALSEESGKKYHTSRLKIPARAKVCNLYSESII